MQPPETPQPSPGQLLRIIKLLAAIVLGTFVVAFIFQSAREEARFRQAMKSLEESNRSIEAIQQKLKEIQERK